MDTEESSTVYRSAEHGGHLLEKNHTGSAQLHRDWLQICTLSLIKTTFLSYKDKFRAEWWCDSWCLKGFNVLVSETLIKHLEKKNISALALVWSCQCPLWKCKHLYLIHVKALQHWDKPRSKGLTWVWTQKSNQKDAPSSSLPSSFITYTNPGVKGSHKTNELLVLW